MGLEVADHHSKRMSGLNRYDHDVIIAGGGLAGLTAAILLGKAGVRTLLIEKKSYPYHKVCGEYLSNETRPFLRSIGIDVNELGASAITRLRISSPQGRNLHAPLDLGGFGISRYTLDHYMYTIAKQNADVLLNTRVQDIKFEDNAFYVTVAPGKTLTAKMVLGSYGKRDTLDKTLDRSFIMQRTGFIAVKYHVRIDYPVNEIGLDNFKDGYCGIVKIEGDRYCLCYLTTRENLRSAGSIGEMERDLLFRNPVLRDIFRNAEFIYDKPEVINEISFSPKEIVKDHIWMAGDSAGLITPLCGNGMSMALHAAKISCGHIVALDLARKPGISMPERERAELAYEREWKKNFGRRLIAGRCLQRMFGSPAIAAAALEVLRVLPPVKKWLIRKTHGQYF
jgi:menaquinone-9 beta-reductase